MFDMPGRKGEGKRKGKKKRGRKRGGKRTGQTKEAGLTPTTSLLSSLTSAAR